MLENFSVTFKVFVHKLVHLSCDLHSFYGKILYFLLAPTDFGNSETIEAKFWLLHLNSMYVLNFYKLCDAQFNVFSPDRNCENDGIAFFNHARTLYSAVMFQFLFIYEMVYVRKIN